MSAGRTWRAAPPRQQPADARHVAAVRRPAAGARLACILVAASMPGAAPAMAATASIASTTHAADVALAATNAQRVRVAFDAWAAGTGSVFDLLHEDVVWTVAGTSPVSGTYTSRQDFLERAVAPITARLSTPIVPVLRQVVAQDDAVVAVFDGTATARDGREYRNSYAWHMVLEDGRIVRVTAFLDTWALQALMEG